MTELPKLAVWLIALILWISQGLYVLHQTDQHADPESGECQICLHTPSVEHATLDLTMVPAFSRPALPMRLRFKQRTQGFANLAFQARAPPTITPFNYYLIKS